LRKKSVKRFKVSLKEKIKELIEEVLEFNNHRAGVETFKMIVST